MFGNLRNRFLLLILLFFPLSVFAQQQPAFDPCALNPSDLSKLGMNSTQLANLTSECASKTVVKGDSLASVKAVAEHSSEIGEAAKGIAEAIGIAASKLGIAVNDFLKSPAGTLTIAFIFLKFFGGKIIGMILLPFYAVCAWAAFNRLVVFSKTYEYRPILWGLVQRRVVVKTERGNWNAFSDSQVFFIACVIIGFCIATAVTVGVLVVN